jgi:hypothetical protein
MRKLYLFILLLIFLLFLLPITEGFEFSSTPLGEYDYLAPIPDSNTWSQDTIDKFIDKYNSVNELPAAHMLKSDTFIANGGLKLALEKEAIYFIINEKWPINKYITEYLTTHKPPIFGQAIPDKPGEVYSLDTLSVIMPSRSIYQLLIAATEMQLTPIPLSYQIFKGTVQPP